MYNLYINDTPQAPGENLTLFPDNTYLYATDRQEGYILRKFQHDLNCMATWFVRWNVIINEEKTRAIYFIHRKRMPDSPITLNGRNFPFVNSVNYLGVISVKRSDTEITHRND
jgi:hypothetical protein